MKTLSINRGSCYRIDKKTPPEGGVPNTKQTKISPKNPEYSQTLFYTALKGK
jgi:hypothetical protein